MADPTAHDLVLALQNNPEVLSEVLLELSSTTACGWEQFGRLHFRRTIKGDVLGWVREPRQGSEKVHFGITATAGQLSTHHPQDDLDLHSMVDVSSWGEARSRIDWHLERRHWHLSKLDPRLPVTEELVAAAAGLMRYDHFQMSQMLQTLADPTLPPNQRSNPDVLLRQAGTSTRVAVRALAGVLTGRRVRVLVRDSQRQDHWKSLFETLVACTGLHDRFHMSIDKVYWKLDLDTPGPIVERMWVLTTNQFTKSDRRDLWPDGALFLHDLA